MHSIFVKLGSGQAPRTAIRPVNQAPAPNVIARMNACTPCSWNTGNRCQHPGQTCAPCKQRAGLEMALRNATFACPTGKF